MYKYVCRTTLHDIIHIIDKYDQEWWQGELNGNVNIFPASYVEEI